MERWTRSDPAIVWSGADIADAIAAGVAREAQALDREQAVAGLDARDEVALHPVVAAALSESDFDVAREQRHPSVRSRRKESEGERCDFVLTPAGRALRSTAARATLFDDPEAVDVDEAYWLEMKVVAQFTEEGANGNYSAQLLSTVRQDVTKLSREPGILRAGLLIMLFVREEAVADHDLGIWQDRCLGRGLPIGAPYRRAVPITDRLGNRVCCLALYPVSHL